MRIHTTSGVILASLAGALSLAALASADEKKSETKPMSEVAHCYGINKCKAVGACGGEGHSCRAQNACKGQGFLDLEKETCLKIEGGRLTAKMEMKMDKAPAEKKM